jgi:uncharacterized membrane protein
MAALLTVLTMIGAAIAVGASLPGDARLPIHWGVDGQPDDFAGKWLALLLPAAVVSGASLLFWFLPSLEPRKEGLARSQGLYLWGWLGLLLVGGALQLAVVSAALGWGLPVNRLVAAAVGAMLAAIGNQLGKSRSMYTIGLRTPWTLASEEVWVRTHRLGGKLMVGAGLVILLAALAPLPAEALPLLIVAAVAAAALVPVVYSYLLWRREAGDQPRG